MKQSLQWIQIWILLFFFFLAGCGTVEYNPFTKKKKLSKDIDTILIHEDLIAGKQDDLQIKQYFIDELSKSLKKLRYKVIQIPAGFPFPSRAQKSILVFGQIWSQRSDREGTATKIVNKTVETSAYTQSWDVIENQVWEKLILQAITSISFLEMDREPRMLRGSMTVWGGSVVDLEGDQGTEKQTQKQTFLIRPSEDDDKVKIVTAVIQIAKPMNQVSDSDLALRKLASKSVAAHLSNLE